MTAFSDALETDIAGNLPDAAHLYEQALHDEDAPLDAYLNLAALYWACIDPGCSRGRSLFTKAAERYDAVLCEAETKYGYVPEIGFWRLYFAFTILGEPPFEEECKVLVTEPGRTLVPYFYIYGTSHGKQYVQQAIRLLADCKASPTTKNRYIISVIEATASSANVAAGIWHDNTPR
ncbi:MAG TPA: hypothetical protein VGN26_22625 [Armatimonadota bacterium]|jgi:hypothetical protein